MSAPRSTDDPGTSATRRLCPISGQSSEFVPRTLRVIIPRPSDVRGTAGPPQQAEGLADFRIVGGLTFSCGRAQSKAARRMRTMPLRHLTSIVFDIQSRSRGQNPILRGWVFNKRAMN